MNTPSKPHDPDNLVDAAFEALRGMAIPDPPPIDPLLAQMNSLAASRSLVAGNTPQPQRFYMRPMFRYAVAASFLIAVFFGLILFTASTPLALADVVKAAEKHKLVRYKVKQSVESNKGPNATLNDICYVDLKAPRSRSGGWDKGTRPYAQGTNLEGYSVWIVDGKKGLALHAITETLIVVDKDLWEKLPEDFRNDINGKFPRKEAELVKSFSDDKPGTDNIAKTFLENVRELEQHKDLKPVKDKRDGKELLKYRLEDEKTTTTLWVDETTKLPFRMERELLDQTPDVSKNHYTLYEFEWDPSLKGVKGANGKEVASIDDLFSVTPPEGFKLTDKTKP
jgi:outer membrane lipoprotein-sorting protein